MSQKSSDLTTALIPRPKEVVSWEQQKELALWAYKSNQFKSIKSAQHALVIMEYGREMGFGAITSLQLIYMVQGVPALKANTIASLIKQMPWRGTLKNRYDYRPVERTAERCTLEFFERNDEGVMELRGQMTYTMKEAELAGDVARNPTYKTRPKNMLFARCVTEGARVYCPDCLGGVVPYCTEELTETDESGEPVENRNSRPGPPREEVQDVEWEEKGVVEKCITEEEFLDLVRELNERHMNLGNVVSAVGGDPNDPRGMSRDQYDAVLRVVKNK